MPTIDERYRSRPGTEGDSPSAELHYIVQGTDNDLEVRNLLATTSPLVYLGLRRSEIAFEPTGGGIWECYVRYERKDSDNQFSFDTGGGSQQIQRGIATVNSYAPPSKTAPNFGGLIGVNGDSVNGTEITVPVYNFSETYLLPPAFVTGAYKQTLFHTTGRVNNGLFKGFAKGELLFLGASGSQRGNEDWEITYRFAGSANVDNFSIGDITGISKEGWQYLWVRFADDEDTSAKTLIKKPVAVYVEQVYEYADLATLGI